MFYFHNSINKFDEIKKISDLDMRLSNNNTFQC